MNICMHFHVTCLLMKILLRDERIHAHPSGKLRKLFFCLLSIQGQQFHTPICPVRWIKLQVRLRKASSFVSRNTDLLLSPRFQELGFSTLPFSGDTHISRSFKDLFHFRSGSTIPNQTIKKCLYGVQHETRHTDVTAWAASGTFFCYSGFLH